MNPRPTVSVIMPAHQVAQYVAQAIESVLAQQGVSFELLIGDDGSTDETWAVVSRYHGDPRVRAWRWGHRGAGATRNRLIARARGPYLALCDADDLLHPGYLARAARVLARRPRVGVVYSDLLLTDAAGRPRAMHQNAGPSEAWDLLWQHVWNPGVLVRRAIMQKVGGYRATLPFLLDYDLFLRLAEVTPFQRLPGPWGCAYRQRRGSLSDQPQRAKQRWITRILRDTIARRYGYRVPW